MEDAVSPIVTWLPLWGRSPKISVLTANRWSRGVQAEFWHPIGCPTKNGKLMPQHKQFDVLNERAATAPDLQPQRRRERKVSKRKEHPPMLPESTAQPREAEPRF
jgi:hypothetical protein